MNATVSQKVLDYYSRPGPMTDTGKYAAMVKELPDDLAALMRIVQGLVVYEYVAKDFYGFDIPEERRAESHLRHAIAMLDRLFELSSEPLTVARPPEKRLVGVCHHFVVLMVAFLRAKGIAARDRWGFGAYFNPGYYEDHVTCEYWEARDQRWKLADVQFDQTWQERLHIDHDVTDVPRDRFVQAHAVWQQCRAGTISPEKVGIFKGNFRGMWFVAGSLVRDAAALNKMELLQWDAWGAIPRPDEPIADRYQFFDRLALLTQDPDGAFQEIRQLYKDPRIQVPKVVFNAVLNRPQAIEDTR